MSKRNEEVYVVPNYKTWVAELQAQNAALLDSMKHIYSLTCIDSDTLHLALEALSEIRSEALFYSPHNTKVNQ